MHEEKLRAVVDADFFIKMTDHDDQNATLFFTLMDDLEFQLIMHKYVAEMELKSFPELKKLIEAGKIIVLDYNDYITDANCEEYEEYFRDAFEQMNKYPFPENEDIFTYHCEDESLGEIRSVYMAKTLQYPYFMSDDGSAKQLADRNSTSKHPITTWNVYEALMQCKERGTRITLKMLNPTISNIFRKRQDKLKKLQEEFA